MIKKIIRWLACEPFVSLVLPFFLLGMFMTTFLGIVNHDYITSTFFGSLAAIGTLTKLGATYINGQWLKREPPHDCVTCRYFIPDLDYGTSYAKCSKPKPYQTHNPITGETKSSMWSVATQRKFFGGCGSPGYWWEPKEMR